MGFDWTMKGFGPENSESFFFENNIFKPRPLFVYLAYLSNILEKKN